MTQTEILRRMLDECGIEWYEASGVTFFGTSGYGTRYAASEPECGIALDPLTPEQVIAATVGRDTCRDTGDEMVFSCSACGFGLRDVRLSDESYLYDDEGRLIEPWPLFCPNCGRKVCR